LSGEDILDWPFEALASPMETPASNLCYCGAKLASIISDFFDALPLVQPDCDYLLRKCSAFSVILHDPHASPVNGAAIERPTKPQAQFVRYKKSGCLRKYRQNFIFCHFI